MDDLEMLERAAKAAGHDFNWRGLHGVVPSIGRGKDQKWWNPLTDDGDRYRLARQLGISIDFSDCCAWKRLSDGGLIQEFWGGDCGDEAHAVVRVAAEIGLQHK